MNERKGIRLGIIPFILTFSCYIIFYSDIESKPNHAGFWFILVLGMSLGVAITRFLLWFRSKDQDQDKD
jgi:hypothetical protein